MLRYPFSVLSFTQAHLCDTPFCIVSRDDCAIPHQSKHRKAFAILRDAEMTIKIIFDRSSQKGVGRWFEKRVNKGPTLKFYCRPNLIKHRKKTAFWKVAFLLSSLFPRKCSDSIFGQLPPSTLQGVGLGVRKNPRIIVGENSCHFGTS